VPYPGEGGPDHYPEGRATTRTSCCATWRPTGARGARCASAAQRGARGPGPRHGPYQPRQVPSLRRLYGGLRVLTILAGGVPCWRSRCSSTTPRRPTPGGDARSSARGRPRPRAWGRLRPCRPRACARRPASPGTPDRPVPVVGDRGSSPRRAFGAVVATHREGQPRTWRSTP
jgi:hypothetical protein